MVPCTMDIKKKQMEEPIKGVFSCRQSLAFTRVTEQRSRRSSGLAVPPARPDRFSEEVTLAVGTRRGREKVGTSPPGPEATPHPGSHPGFAVAQGAASGWRGAVSEEGGRCEPNQVRQKDERTERGAHVSTQRKHCRAAAPDRDVPGAPGRAGVKLKQSRPKAES